MANPEIIDFFERLEKAISRVRLPLTSLLDRRFQIEASSVNANIHGVAHFPRTFCHDLSLQTIQKMKRAGILIEQTRHRPINFSSSRNLRLMATGRLPEAESKTIFSPSREFYLELRAFCNHRTLSKQNASISETTINDPSA